MRLSFIDNKLTRRSRNQKVVHYHGGYLYHKTHFVLGVQSTIAPRY